jgi:DNA-binding Lrp family transcriptional regulator
MDAIDRAILNRLQSDFPLLVRPFGSIARAVGISESMAIGRIASLKERNIIRQMSAIFDSSKIGYRSVLVAFKVEEERLDAVAQKLNAHPGVSHNYLRRGDYNLWFTVTIPQSRDLKMTVVQMARRCGVSEWLFLPTIRRFKINFRLDMGGEPIHGATASANRSAINHQRPFPSNRNFIRELQQDLPLTTRPFRRAAQALGWSEKAVVIELKRYIAAGMIRRFAAILRPGDAGYRANVLVAWAPESEKIELLGHTAAGYDKVSHCYERPSLPSWPYSVYTMIHGQSSAACRSTIRSIARKTGITSYRILPTVKEYKKIRVTYYPS